MENFISISNILSLISLIIIILGGTLVKTFINRSFKAYDDNIEAINNEISIIYKKLDNGKFVSRIEYTLKIEMLEYLEEVVSNIEKNIIRIEEQLKLLSEIREKFNDIEKIKIDILNNKRELRILKKLLNNININK